MVIKCIWSLNTDETLVANEIKEKFSKNTHDVFFPINSTLKDIDLILMNLERMKPITIQVKGSRTYKPEIRETRRYGEGSSAWFHISRKAIYEPSFKIDFFIFVLHNLIDLGNKKSIKINYLIIPSKKFRFLVNKKKPNKKGQYNFFIWIDDKLKRAFDFHDDVNKTIDLSQYLDNWEILK